MAGSVSAAGKGKIQVKLLVDKEKRKVAFAESGKEFVDVLLSFLTMPLGTIVRLLGKESSLGCLDELYKSVESLDASHFPTKACKNMRLHPLSAAGVLHEDLLVRIDETGHRDMWICTNQECFTDLFYYSSVPEVPCGRCGESMELAWCWILQRNVGKGAKYDGVFVRGCTTYATTNDLHVMLMPATSDNLMYLLRDLGVEDVNVLEEQTVEVRLDEVSIMLLLVLYFLETYNY
jgi:hypothetical protein